MNEQNVEDARQALAAARERQFENARTDAEAVAEAQQELSAALRNE